MLITTITNWGYGYTLVNCATPTTSGIYTSAGAGNHYLASGSPYRDVGTNAISADLQADLEQMTTYPPLELTHAVSVATPLSPQATRDSAPLDLGYHHAPRASLAPPFRTRWKVAFTLLLLFLLSRSARPIAMSSQASARS